MEFATGALGSLLPKLGQLLQDEYNLQKGVKKDIEFVRRELESMHAALRDVGEVPQEQLKEVVKFWARDVRELSYDMEDIVDTFLVHVQGSEPPSQSSLKWFLEKMKSIVSKAKTRHEIGQEIKDIKERVKDVAERRDRYKVDATTPIRTSVDPRIAALYTKAASLIGVDEPREELISKLTKQDGAMSSVEQRIVSIVGFGGLGKTTLAKAVYDKLKPQFNCMAFISVSRDPNIIKVLKDILYELDKNEHKDIHNTALGQQHLVELVHEFLKNKRYLIVIDDIWDTEPWEIIRCALPENGLKSRIITTTRIIDVGEQVGGCYKMKPLSDHNSKILFYGRIFGSESNCPKQLYEVSENLLKKCGGIPSLAIVTTSSLLSNKSRNVNEWHDVCDSIGSGLRNNHGMDSMMRILLLSYYDLTPQLKTCLLYLSIFPEDYEIEKYLLIQRWIAEGFIHGGDGRQSLVEVGQSYFNQLLNRSLIQPGSKNADEMNPHSCRVHDMVLDLICSLSREQSFTTTISGHFKEITSSESKARRLSINNTSWPAIDMSKLRSLIVRRYTFVNTIPPPSRFYPLRVLDLESCNLRDHPSLDFVGKLLHLRYLSLLNTEYAGELPREIEKLWFLQTLIIAGTDIKDVPLSIFDLRQLMCLVWDSARLPASGLINLSSLELLQIIVDSASIAEELGHLAQLRVLAVMLSKDMEGRWDESICSVLVESLSKLQKIQTLAVDISDDVEADLVGIHRR